VTIALSASGTGDGLIGFEGSGPGGVRRTTTRLLDGEFPKVRSLFPAEHLTIAKVNKAELIETVKRVALVAERNTPVRLRFTDGQVAIEAGTGDDAQASEAVESTLSGPEIEIAFNPQFLLDGLGAVGTDYSRLSFTQPSRPAVLSGPDDVDGDADTSYRYVLMPVRFAS
jgi:DNA polymerase-3 subunit beta